MKTAYDLAFFYIPLSFCIVAGAAWVLMLLWSLD